MSSIQKINRLSGVRYKAVLKRGEQVLKTKTFTKHSLAKAWLRNKESDRETMEACGMMGSRMTLRQVANLYLKQYSGRDKSQTGKVKYWSNRIGSLYLSDITTTLIRQELNYFSQSKSVRADGCRNPQKIKLVVTDNQRAPATVNRMKAALSAVMRFANHEGLTNHNPVRGIANKPENNKRVRYLSHSECESLLSETRNSEWPRLYALVLMAISTGARKSEMLRLQWQDIDFDRRQAYVSITKNDRPRVLTLPNPVIKALLPFRGIGLVFPSELKPWKPFNFKKHWQRALENANLFFPKNHEKYFRFHDLRHTAASYLVQNGATLYEAGEVLGHKSIETTKRYAHLSVEHKQRLTDRVFGELDDYANV